MIQYIREKWRFVFKKKGSVKIDVFSYLMSQSHSSDQEAWFSLACDLCTAVYNTISIHSQLIINVQQGHNREREREGEREVCGVFAVACL